MGTGYSVIVFINVRVALASTTKQQLKLKGQRTAYLYHGSRYLRKLPPTLRTANQNQEFHLEIVWETQ